MNRLLAMPFILLVAVAGFTQGTWKKESEALIFPDLPFKACHASSIVELRAGEMMVAFFAGPHEGRKDVSIWLATSG